MTRLRYDWMGAALGLALPFVATFVAAWSGAGGFSLRALAAAQSTEPLLWLIDGTPLVLGALGWAVERQQRLLGSQQVRIARLEAQRRVSLERTATELSGTALNLLRDVSSMAAASEQMTASVRGTIETMMSLSRGAMAAALAAETVAGRAVEAASQPDATVESLRATLESGATGAREIARIAQDQMNGIEHALASMNDIHFATETSATSTAEIAAEARALTRRARDLRGAIAACEAPHDHPAPANARAPAEAATAAAA